MSTTKTSARTELTAKPEVPPSGRSKNKDDWGAAVRLLTREAFGVVSDPDPRLIADCVLNSLPSGAADFLVRWALEKIAENELHQLRRPHVAQRVEGASWMARARVILDDLGIAISVGGEHKWVEDCGVEDLLAYAEEQRRRASEIEAKAIAAEKYATALEGCGAATVAEWDQLGRPGLLVTTA